MIGRIMLPGTGVVVIALAILNTRRSFHAVLHITVGVTHSVASRHWSAGLHHTIPLHLPAEAIAVLFLLVDADLYWQQHCSN